MTGCVKIWPGNIAFGAKEKYQVQGEGKGVKEAGAVDLGGRGEGAQLQELNIPKVKFIVGVCDSNCLLQVSRLKPGRESLL